MGARSIGGRDTGRTASICGSRGRDMISIRLDAELYVPSYFYLYDVQRMWMAVSQHVNPQQLTPNLSLPSDAYGLLDREINSWCT